MSRCELAVILCVCLPFAVRGERPVIFPLTTANGLISNSGIFSIAQDSQGYLWIATHEGVSRFDGSEFRNYGTAEGFTSPAQIQDVLVRRNGDVWTSLNVARYMPLADRARRFETIREAPVNEFLREDRQGRLWSLGPNGLYLSEGVGHDAGIFQRICLNNEQPCRDDDEFGSAVEIANDQSLWIGRSGAGVIHRVASGRTEWYGVQEGLPFHVLALMCDRDGRMWAGTSNGVFRMVTRPWPGRKDEARWERQNVFAGCAVHTLRQTRDGHIWAGGRCGLAEIDGSRTRHYSVAAGLTQNVIESILEDRDGELWLGTESAGIMRVERDGISAFGPEAGLEQDVIDGVSLDRDGRVVVISNRDARLVIRAGNEAGFKAILPALALQPTDLGVQHWQVAMQDHDGYWWVPGANEIRIFAPVKDGGGIPRNPVRILNRSNGWPGGRIDCMLEDRSGDVWMGVYSAHHSTLLQWVRSSGQFRSWEGAPGVPRNTVPIGLTQTRSGSIWIAYRQGELGRYRDGKHLLLTPTEKAHGQAMFVIHEDDFGRLWTGRRRSVFYQIEKPDSDNPTLRAIAGVGRAFSSLHRERPRGKVVPRLRGGTHRVRSCHRLRSPLPRTRRAAVGCCTKRSPHQGWSSLVWHWPGSHAVPAARVQFGTVFEGLDRRP